MAHESTPMYAPESGDRKHRGRSTPARGPGALHRVLRGRLDAQSLAGVAAVLAALAVFVDMAARF
jgi:hypothetical protein